MHAAIAIDRVLPEPELQARSEFGLQGLRDSTGAETVGKATADGAAKECNVAATKSPRRKLRPSKPELYAERDLLLNRVDELECANVGREALEEAFRGAALALLNIRAERDTLRRQLWSIPRWVRKIWRIK